MPLFKALPFGRTNQGQTQEVICPRCKTVLEGEEISTYGEGVNTRIVEGEYRCVCQYKVKVIEEYPIINRAIDTERHMPKTTHSVRNS